MDFVDGGDLNKIGEKLVEIEKEERKMEILRLMLILLNELKKLHDANFLHRDIKLHNIMFYQRDGLFYYVFIDFGSSFDLSGNKEKINTYSPEYSPPEQNEENGEKEGFHTDIYSLGVTFEKLLTNNKNFGLKVAHPFLFFFFFSFFFLFFYFFYFFNPFFFQGDFINKLLSFVKKMRKREIDKRPSLNDCIYHLINLNRRSSVRFKTFNNLVLQKFSDSGNIYSSLNAFPFQAMQSIYNKVIVQPELTDKSLLNQIIQSLDRKK